MFTSYDKFEYNIPKSGSLHGANPSLGVKSFPGSEGLTYTLSISGDHLRLKNKKKRCKDDLGEVEFNMESGVEDKKLDFVSIERKIPGPSLYGRVLSAHLMLRVWKENFEYRERTMPFKVIVSNTDSISMRKKKSLEKSVVNIGYSYLREIEDQLWAEKTSEDEESSFPIEEEYRTCFQESTTPFQSLCIVVNIFKYKKKEISPRPQSWNIVRTLNHIIGGLCKVAIKGLFNCTKDTMFVDLKEMIDELTGSKGQLLIIIMSHGSIDGFHIYDHFVTRKQFLDGLSSVVQNIGLMKVFLFGFCQDIPLNRPTFHVIHDSSSEEEECGSSSRSDIMDGDEYKRSIQNELHGFNGSHPHMIWSFAAEPGEKSSVLHDGSLYMSEFLDEVKHHMVEKGSCDLEDVLPSVNNRVGDTKMIFKGNEMLQRSWQCGALTEPFILGDMENEDDILTLGPRKETEEVDIFSGSYPPRLSAIGDIGYSI